MIDLNTGGIGDNRRLAKVPAGDVHIHDLLNTAEEEILTFSHFSVGT
jgi:hypothetical protein